MKASIPTPLSNRSNSTSTSSASPNRHKPVRKRRWLLVLLAGGMGLAAVTEVVLRQVYGFTDAVLFRSDAKYEYIAVPQSRYRFRKHINYNSLSQRNREITSADSVALLGFGDSVLNGGSQTDQDSLATTRLSGYLSHKYHRQLLVVNISAGSWGPDNCYAYLKQFGSFGAKKMLLVVSSHDAYDDMNHEQVVDVLPNYPSKQYPLALQEVASRYVYPRLKERLFPQPADENLKGDNLLINKRKPGMAFNPGFAQFKHYADSTKLALLVYLHAERNELAQKKYNEQGDKIIAFCKENNIPLVRELDYNFVPDDYRAYDDIHLSEQGQRHMFDVLKQYY